ncbi:MAG: hypothetical protein LQ347_002763 [Umbilicaria vellea]|nr:MAG: hypothetical protein LQ347_002763 [Umbilicaria vellea]
MSVNPPRPHPLPATCEDWNEDARTTIPDTRRTANSAAKRSSKPDISLLAKAGEENAQKAPKPGKDGANDSGYSSQTAATVDSGGSSQRSRLGLAPLTVDTGAANEKAKKAPPESKPKSAARKSPTKLAPHAATSRNQSKESARPEGCECAECAAKKKPAATPVESRSPQGYFVLHQPSRARGAGPPSPQSARAPPPDYVQQTPFVNPGQSRPRPPTTQSHRMARPMSFHAGMMPDGIYFPPPQTYVERRTQPVFVTAPIHPLPVYPPPSATYVPAPVQPVPPTYPLPSSYEQPRPQPPYWPAESHVHPSRHSALYEPPIIQYGEQKVSYTNGVPPQHYSQPAPRDPDFYRPYPIQEYVERGVDYHKMPPPPAPTVPSHQRPAIRHAATTSAAHATLHPSHNRDVLPPLSSKQTNVSFQRLTHHESVPEQQPRSRRQSLSARVPAGPPRKTYNSASNDKILVERAHVSDKQRRRASYYGQDALEREAERYQHDTNNAPGAPIKTNPTIDTVKLGHKHTQSQASVAGSRSSTRSGGRSRESSDVKPRSGVSNRPVADGTEADAFAMRFPAGVKVDVKGDGVEGRTITFQQSGDGDGSIELRIGGRKAGDEGSERSDRTRGTIKPYSHAGGASHGATVSHSDMGPPSRNASRMRRASMHSDSAAPSRSTSRMRRSSHLEELAEPLRTGDRSRRQSRTRDYEEAAFRENTTGNKSRRSSPAKEVEDVTLTERRLVRTESRSGGSSRSGYSGK